MDSKEYWKILLQKQRERGRNGFTLPFILGSQIFLPNLHVHQTIEDLILFMCENTMFETSFRYCTDSYEFIFEIRNPNNQVFFPLLNDVPQNGLSIAKMHLEFGSTIDELIKTLCARYSFILSEGLYSVKTSDFGRSSEWQHFDDRDRQFIKSCFSYVKA